MKYIVRCYIILVTITLFAGCSRALIKAPLVISIDRWHITLEKLASGPDQYNTAGGYWEPKKGKRFIWATIRIRNDLKTDQQFLLDRIMLSAGERQVKPLIMDMNSAVTMRANPAPRLKAGETITRRLIYIVPKGIIPEKITYEKKELIIPVLL